MDDLLVRRKSDFFNLFYVCCHAASLIVLYGMSTTTTTTKFTQCKLNMTAPAPLRPLWSQVKLGVRTWAFCLH